MKELDIKKYFENENKEYISPKFLVLVLERYLGKDFETIKKEVFDAKITITEEEIIEFLDKTFTEEEPELKKRIEEEKSKSLDKQSYGWKALSEEEIEKEAKKFGDRLNASRYDFEPYTFEYYNRYTKIVKEKTLQLLNIIEQLVHKNIYSIENVLIDLDIVLDDNDNISKKDIIRLVKPTIQNIKELFKMINEANNLDTYLNVKMSIPSLAKNDLSEREIYPSRALIIKDLYGGYHYGNVPISERQEKQLQEELRKSSQILAKIITRLK